MSHTLFISDLHLCSTQPRVTELFLQFARDIAPKADSLYILGDLFEYWIGDDDLADPFNHNIAQTLRKISDGGVKLYFMHGNRDFLLGEKFAAACGAKLLSDPLLIDLHGTPTLLTHGDALCTDDTEYQAFRKQVRDPEFQKQFLAKPLSERKATVEKMRAQSEQSKKIKSMGIMDVTESAVHDLLRQYKYPRLIHGHTHRPALHRHHVDGKTCERFVLKDWNETGGYLRCDASGCS
ncbi:MAG: UDP-2,3-diacylglucosamine diphosphatase, partial [Burkholderiales bacterium]